MRVRVDSEQCQGCGLCEAHAPDVFKISDDGVAVVTGDVVPPELEDAVRRAVSDCPTEAVHIA